MRPTPDSVLRTSHSVLQTHHFVLPAAHAQFGIADVPLCTINAPFRSDCGARFIRNCVRTILYYYAPFSTLDAKAAIVSDIAATVLLNTHVFTTLQRQYFSSRMCSSFAATVHDTAATVLLNRRVFATLERGVHLDPQVFTPLLSQSTTPQRHSYYSRRCS